MRIFVSFLFLLLYGSNAIADTQTGINLFNSEDYIAAEQEFLEPVKSGDPVAIRYYANMLYMGRGVGVDRERAKQLLRDAYAKGDTASGSYLASLLSDYWIHFSSDEPQNVQTARLKEAVELYEDTYTGPTGNDPATFIVNTFVDSKSEIAPKESIILWFKRGVLEGHGTSAWFLARSYSNGNGVPKDIKESFYWAEYAAFLNHPEAMNTVGELYAQGNFGPPNPEAGLALIVQSAKERYNPAMVHVAIHFANEQEDYGMAWRVLQLAYDRGMEETEQTKGFQNYLLSKNGNIDAKSIEDFAYNGRFESLIQETIPAFNKASNDFKSRIKPIDE